MQGKKCLLGLLVGVGLVLFSGAVHPENKPDWVDGLSLEYPDHAYLTGVGFGDSRQEAEDSAHAALARIFRSEVHSVTHEIESFRQKEDRGQEIEIKRDVQIQSETSVTTDKVLEQVQIVAHWVDSVSKVHYALGVLNRSKSESGLRQKRMEAETDARMWEKRAKQATDNLEKARALQKALTAALQMEVYGADLRIVAPDMGKGIIAPGYAGDIQAQLRHLLNQHFQVGVEISGPHALEVQAAILEGLHRKGFRSGPAAKLIVEGAVQFQKVGPKGPTWHFVRWDTRIILREKESGRIFGTIRRSGREGKLSPEAAERKALTVLQSELSQSIGDEVNRFIFGG